MLDFLESITTSPDALTAPIWVLANVALAAGAWQWSRRCFPLDSWMESGVHAVLLWWSGVNAVATTLGAVGVLTGPALLAGVMLVALAALSVFHAVPARAAAPPIALDRAGIAWLLAWGALLCYWVGHIITQGLLRFPTDWDSLSYHLPLINHWLQAESLYSTDCCRWANAGNNEILVLWMTGPFSGDFLGALNNLPSTALLGLAGVALGTRLGLSATLAHLGGMLLVCNVVVLRQLADQSNDVAATACFVAALYYIVRQIDGGSSVPAVLAALALGLLAGIKFYALGYAVLLLGVWVLLGFLRLGMRRSLGILLIGGTGMLAMGCFWYLRNLVMTGTPLYPREPFVRPDLLVQIYPDVAHTSFFGNGRQELLELYLRAIWRMTGPAQLAGFVLAPFSFCWLLLSAAWIGFRNGNGLVASRRLGVALVLAGAAVVLGITPFCVEDDPGTLNQMHWQYCPVRYGLCFLSISIVAALVFLHDLFAWGKDATSSGARWSARVGAFAVALTVAGAVVYQLTRTDTRFIREMPTTLLIACNLLLAGVVLAMIQAIWPRLRVGWLLLILILPLASAVCVQLADRWHRGFTPHFDQLLLGGGLEWLDKRGPSADTVGALEQRYYPYFGSRRERRVCQPVYIESPDWLMAYLERENITVVRVKLRRAPGGWQRHLGFDECLASNPAVFRLTHEFAGAAQFEVQRDSSPSPLP